MKRLLLTPVVMLAFALNAYSIHIDSLKLVPASDTTYYLAIYGLVAPYLPCSIIDSTKIIGEYEADISLCYLSNSSLTIGCKATDSIFLGALPNTQYLITLRVAITNNYTNTCQTTSKKDTFEIQRFVTNLTAHAKQSFNLYPNPAGSVLTIQAIPLTTEAIANITTVQGQHVRQVNVNTSTDIPVKDLPAGMYLLTIQSGERRWVKRFVKL